MNLEYLIEDLRDTLEEGLKQIKNLNKYDVELYNHIWGDEANNALVGNLKASNFFLSNNLDDLVNDIEYESRRLRKSNFDDNHEPLPTIKEWVTDTLNDMDINGTKPEEVNIQVLKKIADNTKNETIVNTFIDFFKDQDPEIGWDITSLIDDVDTNINAMLNENDYQYLVDFIDSIPFKMPKYNIELDDQQQEYFSESDRIATGLVYELEPITDMVVEYVNSKDLDTDQEEDYDM